MTKVVQFTNQVIQKMMMKSKIKLEVKFYGRLVILSILKETKWRKNLSSVKFPDYNPVKSQQSDLKDHMPESVVIKKLPSMLRLQNCRDPQFVRKLKSARIVNKAGDRNSYAVHLPQKSGRFLKDIVHTLVGNKVKKGWKIC